MGRFKTTVWEVIAGAREGDSQAVRSFVDRYRPPLLEFVGLKGYSPADAEDLAQEVFLRLFSKDLLDKADPRKGRFRRLIEELPYAEVAAKLGKSVEHVRVDLHRAKQRLIRLIKQEIATYCSSEEEFDEELETFLAAFERG